MAEIKLFDQFFEDLSHGVHDLENDTFAVYLTNATPDEATDAIKSDLAEISTGNGYSGPISTAVTFDHTSGTVTVALTDKTVTASGAVGPFRYVVVMNDSKTDDPLIGYADYGSAITLQDTETFDIDFSGPLMTIAQGS